MKEIFEFKMFRRDAAVTLPGKSPLESGQEIRNLTNPLIEEVRSQAMGHVNGFIYERVIGTKLWTPILYLSSWKHPRTKR